VSLVGECVPWSGTINKEGYGHVYVGCKPGSVSITGLAHRVIYERAKGPIPDGLCIDHLCRNRACVNPEHMEPVTIGENTRRGDLAKLTWDDAKTIRRCGGGVRATARRYGIDHSVVSRIRAKKAWWPEP
jgi:hypothetical protein